MMPLFLCGISLVFFPILSDTHYLAGLLPNMFFSAFLTVFNIRFISTVQHLTENDYLGRVLSIVYSVATLLMPVGTILFSVVNITDSVRVLGIIGVALAILSMRLKKFTLWVSRYSREELIWTQARHCGILIILAANPCPYAPWAVGLLNPGGPLLNLTGTVAQFRRSRWFLQAAYAPTQVFSADQNHRNQLEPNFP